mmetsp:Transcript_24397/g.50701  ORF Transcript_24397/g.50701 Transcript_24397/m.50701 type:complete len:219 (+) Transcript_24397:424-1080(+)
MNDVGEHEAVNPDVRQDTDAVALNVRPVVANASAHGQDADLVASLDDGNGESLVGGPVDVLQLALGVRDAPLDGGKFPVYEDHYAHAPSKAGLELEDRFLVVCWGFVSGGVPEVVGLVLGHTQLLLGGIKGEDVIPRVLGRGNSDSRHQLDVGDLDSGIGGAQGVWGLGLAQGVLCGHEELQVRAIPASRLGARCDRDGPRRNNPIFVVAIAALAPVA